MSAYPGALDSLSNPGTVDTLATAPHHQQHTDANDAIEAIEAKLGIGSSVAGANTILAGTGAGQSAWIASPLVNPTLVTWSPSAAIVAPDTTAVDTGFQIDYLAAGEKWSVDFWLVHNRQAAGGGIRFRWHPTAAFTGGLIRMVLQLGQASGKIGDGFTDDTPTYDTWYGGSVPDANNVARYGRYTGTIITPTTPVPGTIKLQVSSVSANEAQLAPYTWVELSKLA